MTSKKTKVCGKCGWQRALVCRNPKAKDADKHVGAKSYACAEYVEVKK